MADTKISADASAGTLDGTETIPVVAGGANKRTTGAALLTYIQGAISIAQSQVSGLTAALSGKLAAASNLSDLANAGTARTNLGLGTAATTAATDYAPAAHVGAGGTAHANAVASGAAGFLTGADKAKLDGVASGATANAGTVTSVALSVPGTVYSVSGSPVTSAGTLALSLQNQSANTVFAGPASGAAAAPTFRALAAADIPAFDVASVFEFRDDFLMGLSLATTTSGTGASATNNSTGAVDTGGHPGLCELSTGTTTTGRAALLPGGSALSLLLLGNGAVVYESLIYLEDAVSDGTDTYQIIIGFNDSATGTGTDMVAFRYTHSVNSGKFEAVTRANGTETAADTGITVATATWYKLRIEVNAAASSVVFKINGSTVATNTTNIPSGTGRQLSHFIGVIKSAGTNARRLLLDYVYTRIDLSVAR